MIVYYDMWSYMTECYDIELYMLIFEYMLMYDVYDTIW